MKYLHTISNQINSILNLNLLVVLFYYSKYLSYLLTILDSFLHLKSLITFAHRYHPRTFPLANLGSPDVSLYPFLLGQQP
nr:MAG TPA: hypothetical protein [Caudoviricetes sp.]